MDTNAALYRDQEETLFSREKIAEAVKLLGHRIEQDYQGKDLVMIGILKGAVIFFSDLVREIDLPLQMDFMAVSSYGNATKSSGVVRIIKDLDKDIVGKHILIVEDIVDTGLTLSFLMEVLGARGAASIEVACLLDKELSDPSKKKLHPAYCCFTVPDRFVVGYGLDYAEKYRNLPSVTVLSPRVYE